MNKMKLFAIVSVLCLGVAAIANTQSHAKATIDGYKDDGSNHCTVLVSQACCDMGTADCIDVNFEPLYQRSPGPCANQLLKCPKLK
jgi:hypothetical protein